MFKWNTRTFALADNADNTITESGQWPASTIQYDASWQTPDVQEVQRDGRRWYEFNNHLYPSISTVLSHTDVEGRAALTKWRKSVGESRAAQITQTAAARGTRWHTFCEKFVLREEIPWPLLTECADSVYATLIANVLNQQITRVLAVETRVASTHYKVAGRLDMAVELHDGRAAILDFKTGSKQKTGNRLENYALQATFYADALTEHMRRPIETIVIAQLLPQAIIWQESTLTQWRPLLVDRIEQFMQAQQTILA